MDWDAIRTTYPDDAPGIDRARRIHAVVMDRVGKLDLPPVKSLPADTGIEDAVPYGPLAEAMRGAWTEVMGREPDVNLEQALKSFVAEEPFEESRQDVLDVLPMLLRPAVTGYLRRLRESASEQGRAEPGTGRCPFCGTYPRIALDSDTSRELACLLCGQQWRFSRLACPFCGNDDHETLGYFDLEGLEGIRVQYCSQCRHYLKVVDTRARMVRDPETEDVLSMDLDTAAQEEGYL
jgi:formate dehydrogenase maturation protein FdhE